MAKKLPKLEYWVQKYSNEFWGKNAECKIVWNKRITRKNGQVLFSRKGLKPFRLEISPSTVRDNCFEKVVLHELCHYHLLASGINHRELDEVFLNELRRVGGAMPHKVVGTYYKCGICGDIIYSSKKKYIAWETLIKYKKCDCIENYIMMNYQYEEVK